MPANFHEALFGDPTLDDKLTGLCPVCGKELEGIAELVALIVDDETTWIVHAGCALKLSLKTKIVTEEIARGRL